MKQYTDLEYLKLSKGQRLLYRIASFFCAIPGKIGGLFVGLWNLIKTAGLAIGKEASDIWTTFVHGDWKTKLSYLVMGFGNLARGQILRGLLFLLFEVVFIAYMILAGGYWLSMLPSLGKVGPTEEYNIIFDTYVTTYNDNSFKILLYGVLTIFFIIAFIYTWRVNVKQNQMAEKILASGKKLKSGKDDLRSLVDDQFHKTLLALPMTGIIIFTVLPIVFMILVAFTNYDGAHDGYYSNLFTWVGLDNFNTMLNWNVAKGGGGVQSYAATFGDPKIYLPEGEGIIPAACKNENLSDYRMYVPDCQAYKGMLGAVEPYRPEALAGKVGTWCNRYDILCSSYFSIKSHTSYAEDGLYEDASRYIAPPSPPSIARVMLNLEFTISTSSPPT